MQFTDTGIVLSTRKLSEYGAIIQVLTSEHGVHAGVDNYAYSKARRGLWQPGNRVKVTWQARLSEHIGSWNGELADAVAAKLLDDAIKLTVLQSACALTESMLAERDPHPEIFAALMGLTTDLTLDNLLRTHLVSPDGHMADFMASYVLLELILLQSSGMGLDLSSCAITGETQGLGYISPKTGRAVTRAAGEPYRDKLLRLPNFLQEARKSAVLAQDVLDGLALTGYFLGTRALAAKQGKLPVARERMMRILDQVRVKTKVSEQTE